jgi:ubiquinone/menaquinone biosynthesis C-methylase UbiE
MATQQSQGGGAMNIRESYSRWAATYDTDRNLTRDLDQEVTRQILADRRFGSILEIGCGTGKNTALLARLGDRVQAIDFSEGMIEEARAKVAAANVTFSVADITQPWPCADRSVDLVVCNLVLEHIAELDFIFAEASRTLIEGGQFFVCELHPFRQYGGTQANFTHDSEQIAIPAFVHHLSDFLMAAERAGLTLRSLREWWHDEDQGKPPRLVSFLFAK